METIDAFFQPVEDVATFWAAGAKVDGVFVTHGNSNDALTIQAVAVQIVNDLTFQFILVGWIDDTGWVFALEVNVDLTAAGSNGTGLFPIDLFDWITVFIFFKYCVAKFAKNTNIAAKGIADEWLFFFFRSQQTMVGEDGDGPAFIEIVQEAAKVTVGLLICFFNRSLIAFLFHLAMIGRFLP